MLANQYHECRRLCGRTGLTPKAYAAARRARKLEAELNSAGGTVTEAIYEAGFNSSSCKLGALATDGKASMRG